DHLLHVAGSRHIAGDADDLAAGRADELGRPLQPGSVDIADPDLRALPRELDRRHAPLAAAGAGDEGDLVLKSHRSPPIADGWFVRREDSRRTNHATVSDIGTARVDPGAPA